MCSCQSFIQASRLLGLPDDMSPNTPCYNETREQRTDDAQQLQESDDPSSSSQMPRAEEIDQKFEENSLTSDSQQTQEPAVLSGSLLPKSEVLEQNVNPSEGTCDDLRHFKSSFSTQPPNTELLDQNFTRHPAEDTCGVKQPAAVLISPLLPKAEVLDQNFQELAVAGPLISPEHNANALVNPAQYQTVYFVSGGFPQTQSSSVPKTQSSSVPKTQSSSVPKTQSSSVPKTQSSSVPKTQSSSVPQTHKSSPIQKPKGQRRRRVCTRADCPFCNIPPCGACRPCTNPDSRSRCILR